MKNKKVIVVTGGAGFIGFHLCKRLIDLGYHVISLDNYFTGSRNVCVQGVDYREGHTKDIEKYIPESPEIVYHLGEYSRVEVSLSEPALVWDLNIAGTFGVVEFWKKHNTKLVYAGSSTKFADGGMGRYQSPYAFTKATNTELVCNYADWYNLKYAITYFYNVYGPGERPGKYGTVIEIFRQNLMQKKPHMVTSPGTQKRNFTHVEDIIDGLVLIGEKGQGDEFGLGASDAYSILEIAEIFGGIIQMQSEAKGNRMGSKLDTTKSYTLGWRPKHRVVDYIKNLSDTK